MRSARPAPSVVETGRRCAGHHEIQPAALLLADPDAASSPRLIRAHNASRSVAARSCRCSRVRAAASFLSRSRRSLPFFNGAALARLRRAASRCTRPPVACAQHPGQVTFLPACSPARRRHRAVRRAGRLSGASVAIGERGPPYRRAQRRDCRALSQCPRRRRRGHRRGIGPSRGRGAAHRAGRDGRFRPPVGVLDNAGIDDERLPNLSAPKRSVRPVDHAAIRADADVRDAPQAHAEITETEGVIDPDTGLLAPRRSARPRPPSGGRGCGGAPRSRRFSFEGSPTAAPTSMPPACSAGWCATSISPAGAGRRDPRRLHRTDLRSARGGAPDRERSSTTCWHPTATASPSSRRSRWRR